MTCPITIKTLNLHLTPKMLTTASQVSLIGPFKTASQSDLTARRTIACMLYEPLDDPSSHPIREVSLALNGPYMNSVLGRYLTERRYENSKEFSC